MNQVNQRLGDLGQRLGTLENNVASLGRRLAALEPRPKPQPGDKGEEPEPKYFWVNVYNASVQQRLARSRYLDHKEIMDRYSLGHAEACSGVGALPATNQGYGICASSFIRVTRGVGHQNIFYPEDYFEGSPNISYLEGYPERSHMLNLGTQVAVRGFCFDDGTSAQPYEASSV